MQNNKSVEFIESIDELWQMEIPKEVCKRAIDSLLDYLAVTCAGAYYQKDKIEKYCEFAQPEKGSFKVIGVGKNVTLKEAVFINGLNSHALDFDDGTNTGIIHLGAPIFSLLIPLAQRYNVPISDMLRAAIIGYESSFTLAASIQPKHKSLGYHATGTCGTIGATIAASYMLNFNHEERFQAFAIACVSASGMLKVLDGTSELKPYNVAKTSLLSLTALQLAKAGFKGHTDPFGGRGFFKMMTGCDVVNLKPLKLNGSYAIMKSYTKPYASCRYTHPAIEATIRIRDKVKIEDIKEIIVETYELAVAGHDHIIIPNTYSAKMSIPYSTAVGLIYGKVGLSEFSDTLLDDIELMKLVRKIKVMSNDDLTESFPATQTAIVSVKTKDNTYVERVDYPKGEPENPLTEDEFKTRFDELMKYACISKSVSMNIYDLARCEKRRILVDTLIQQL